MNIQLFLDMSRVRVSVKGKAYLQIVGIVNKTFRLALGVIRSSRGAFLSIQA